MSVINLLSNILFFYINFFRTFLASSNIFENS
nr:MAG TPA: hypothetical protein [Caudoviricetes sp.]